jgi:hypothetical protein
MNVELIVVIGIVALAAFSVVWRLAKLLKGGKPSCGCDGCDKCKPKKQDVKA